MRVDVTYIWYSEDGRCYLLDVFYGFTQKLLKSSFKIKEIPDCSIVTLPEDLTSRRFDCSKFTLFTNNDSQYIWIKFSSIVTIYNIMREFIQYHTLMQNDSVEITKPQISIEENYVRTITCMMRNHFNSTIHWCELLYENIFCNKIFILSSTLHEILNSDDLTYTKTVIILCMA